jgi:predicted nucleic acid-binding Zn ribbon protein
MPVRRVHEDDNDESADPDFPDESDMDSFDEPGLMPCPHCRKMISEDAEQCPHCHEYISLEDAPRRPLPMWFVVGLVVALLIALIAFVVR